MIQQIMIPVAAFAITAAGVSAFSGDLLEKLDIDLTSEQVSALEEAHELRLEDADRDEVHAVLEDAGIDRETMQNVREAVHEYREEMRENVHAALEDGDYDAFLEAIEGTPLEDVIDTENEFEQFMDAFDLRQSGDHEGAREIMDELGLERPQGFGNQDGTGQYGERGEGDGLRDGSGAGEKMGNRSNGGFRSNQN